MTVARLSAEMTAREFKEWQAYFDIEPFGEKRADLRAGIVASTVHNMQTRHSLKPSDFMPDFGPKRRQTVAEMQARILVATGAKIG